MPRRTSPVLARVAPFAVYIAFLVAESAAGEHFDGRWLYAAQVAVVAALLVWFWPAYGELRRPSATPARDWVLGLAVGTVVFGLWINLEFPWAQIGAGRGIAGELAGGDRQAAGALLRLLGAVLVVPVMEELFWRSFLARWLQHTAFLTVDPRSLGWRPILISAVVFGAEHHLWLAGIVAGLAYGWLYRQTGSRSLWTVILAHALTNALLEVWVHRTGNWHFL